MATAQMVALAGGYGERGYKQPVRGVTNRLVDIGRPAEQRVCTSHNAYGEVWDG